MPRAKWYQKLRDAGKCTSCEGRPAIPERALCELCAAKQAARSRENNKRPEVQAAKREYKRLHPRKYDPVKERERRERTRENMLLIAGGKCVRCNMSDRRALQIDHVHGGGCREVSIKDGGLSRFLKRVKEGELQVLCANCNWIKRHENGEVRGSIPKAPSFGDEI